MKRNMLVVVLVPAVALIAACGGSGPGATASPSPSVAASPAGPAASPTSMSVAAVNGEIRSKVTGADPLLLPDIPSNWSATLANLSSWSFSVIYSSPDGAKTVEFAIVVPNPPPPGPNGTQAQPTFHGDVHSLYQVDDKTQPIGYRWLMWNEPGTWTEPNGLPGVPYFLITKGLTETEFWAVANSLK